MIKDNLKKLTNYFRGDSGNKQTNTDGWANVNTKLGNIGKDRAAGNQFAYENFLDQNLLEGLYRSNGFAKKIVDIIADEMTRQWFTVEGDPDNAALNKLEKLGAKNKVRDLIRWARLYGGAVMFVGLDDTDDLMEPVNEGAIREVKFLHVYDRFQVTWFTGDINNDPRNPLFGQPELYYISPYESGAPFKVHASRVIRIEGEEIPNRLRAFNQYWNDSVLQVVYEEIKNLGGALNSSRSIIEDFVQTIIQIDNLSDLIATGQDDLVYERLNILDLTRSTNNTIMLDSNETYQKQSSSVAGLDVLIDKFKEMLSSSTGIPITFLFGTAPGGLNATGEADVRMFYDKIKAQQEDKLQPALEQLLRFVFISKRGPFNGREPKQWSIKFNPLWQLTEKEEADFRKTVAETDAIYLDRGVVDAAEIAISRYGGDSYSHQTELQTTERAGPTGEPPQEEAPDNTSARVGNTPSESAFNNQNAEDSIEEVEDADPFHEDEETFQIPIAVKTNAKEGLKQKKKYRRGSSQAGINAASTLKNRDYVSLTFVKRMAKFFDMHKNKNISQDDPPSNAFITWLLWGGDAGRRWAEAVRKARKNKNKDDKEQELLDKYIKDFLENG